MKIRSGLAPVIVAMIVLFVGGPMPRSLELTAQVSPARSWAQAVPLAGPYPAPTVTPTPCPPPATPEPFWVEPVYSPTGLLYQTVIVRLGRGRSVTVRSESGSATVTGRFDAYARPAYVTIPLLPDTVHHLVISGTVEYAPGCTYTLETASDRYGNPLVIEQRLMPLMLPLVYHHRLMVASGQ